MNNFVESIEESMNDDRQRAGRPGQVIVNAFDLNRLLEHYKKIESYYRVEKTNNEPAINLYDKLRDILQAMYYKRYDSERIMLHIMEVLAPLSRKRIDSLIKEKMFKP